MRGLTSSINETNLEKVKRSFEVLNSFLEGREFAAGDNLTIADFAISTTICTILVSFLFVKNNYVEYIECCDYFLNCSVSILTLVPMIMSRRITIVAKKAWRNLDSKRCTPWVLKCLPRSITRICKNLVNADMAMDIFARLK